jgi:hypothetical protein
MESEPTTPQVLLLHTSRLLSQRRSRPEDLYRYSGKIAKAFDKVLLLSFMSEVISTNAPQAATYLRAMYDDCDEVELLLQNLPPSSLQFSIRQVTPSPLYPLSALTWAAAAPLQKVEPQQLSFSSMEGNDATRGCTP